MILACVAVWIHLPVGFKGVFPTDGSDGWEYTNMVHGCFDAMVINIYIIDYVIWFLYSMVLYIYISMFVRYGWAFGTRVLKTRVPERAF